MNTSPGQPAKIPVRRGGAVAAYAFVDESDAAGVRAHSWALDANGYAVRAYRANGTRLATSMHRQVLGLQPGDPGEVDHIDGNRLNNTRANLRVVTGRVNNINRHVSKFGVPGVMADHRGKTTRYSVTYNQRSAPVHIGRFETLEEALAVARVWRADNLPESPEARAGVSEAERELARAALTKHEQQRNRVRGVGFHKSSGTWRAWAQVRENGKWRQLHIGHYKTREEAVAARLAWNGAPSSTPAREVSA